MAVYYSLNFHWDNVYWQKLITTVKGEPAKAEKNQCTSGNLSWWTKRTEIWSPVPFGKQPQACTCYRLIMSYLHLGSSEEERKPRQPFYKVKKKNRTTCKRGLGVLQLQQLSNQRPFKDKAHIITSKATVSCSLVIQNIAKLAHTDLYLFWFVNLSQKNNGHC